MCYADKALSWDTQDLHVILTSTKAFLQILLDIRPVCSLCVVVVSQVTELALQQGLKSARPSEYPDRSKTKANPQI